VRLDPLLAFLFPPRCVGCGWRGQALCRSCREGLPYLPIDVCARCASRRTSLGACRGCQRLSPRLATLRAVCAYEGAARHAVHTLKFRSGRCLAAAIGELMRQSLERRPLRADVVAPAPIAPKRLRERGYNQAELLAGEIAELVGGVGACVPDLLQREDRPAQQSLPAAQRLVNLRGAIACAHREEVRGRRVVLVDDVATTGATLSACAEALAAAGASRVSAIVFARDL
jgi:ComF family protein